MTGEDGRVPSRASASPAHLVLLAVGLIAVSASGPLMAAALRLVSGGAVELDALAAREEPTVPWLLERNEYLLAPDFETAPVAAGVM